MASAGAAVGAGLSGILWPPDFLSRCAEMGAVSLEEIAENIEERLGAKCIFRRIRIQTQHGDHE